MIRKTEDHATAYWSIQQYGGDIDESFVKANRAGVLLFAADLLEAGIETPDQHGRATRGLNTIDQDGEIRLDHVELVQHDASQPPEEPKIRRLWKALAAGLWIALIVFILLCLVVGFKTIVTNNW